MGDKFQTNLSTSANLTVVASGGFKLMPKICPEIDSQLLTNFTNIISLRTAKLVFIADIYTKVAFPEQRFL